MQNTIPQVKKQNQQRQPEDVAPCFKGKTRDEITKIRTDCANKRAIGSKMVEMGMVEGLA